MDMIWYGGMILFFQDIKKKVAVIGKMARSWNQKNVARTTTEKKSKTVPTIVLK
jgi:hypothetical protein